MLLSDLAARFQHAVTMLMLIFRSCKPQQTLDLNHPQTVSLLNRSQHASRIPLLISSGAGSLLLALTDIGDSHMLLTLRYSNCVDTVSTAYKDFIQCQMHAVGGVQSGLFVD